MKRSIVIAFVCGLTVSACSSHKKKSAKDETARLGEIIEENVENKDHAEQLQRIQDKIYQMTIDYSADVENARSEWLRINQDYDAPLDAFASAQQLLSAKRRHMAEVLIRYAMEARRIATPEEWAAMAKGLRD